MTSSSRVLLPILALFLLPPLHARFEARTGAAQDPDRDAVLAVTYPGAEIREEHLLLTPSQQKQVLTSAAVDVPSALVARYVATRDGRVVGRAYVDTDPAQTRRESLLVSLDARGQVLRVDVTPFIRSADRAVTPDAGGMIARATNTAVQRILAIDEVLETRGDAR